MENPRPEIRGLRDEEYPQLLAMLARVMAAPRSFFAARYRHDPHGSPEQSRVALVNGRIVAHLRLYDRWQLVGGVPVHVGCVGDVCTLPDYRNRGYCRALLEDALAYWRDREYDLSQIVSGVGVYRRCGWVCFPEVAYRAPAVDCERACGETHGRYTVRRFARGQDLAAVAEIHARYHEGRSLATVRTPLYWERHFYWITNEREEAFLLAESGSEAVAYARGSHGGDRLMLSECCYRPEHPEAVGALLDAFFTLAARAGYRFVEAVLPEDHPAVAYFVAQPLWTAEERTPLLFRLVDLPRLLHRLEPLLSQRLRKVVLPSGAATFTLVVGDQKVGLTLAADSARVVSPAGPELLLTPSEFFLLLFGQANGSELAGVLAIADPVTRALLAALFPRGAPIYWRPDIV